MPRELRSGLDDNDAWEQEYECQAADTSNVLLPYDLIAQAETIDARKSSSMNFSGSGINSFAGSTLDGAMIPRSAGRWNWWATFSGRAK